jgi:hypothetical protein
MMAGVRTSARKRSKPIGRLQLRWAQPFPRTGGVLNAHPKSYGVAAKRQETAGLAQSDSLE